MPETDSNSSSLPAPPVVWAQRHNLVYLKIALEDCKNPTIKLDKDKLYFRGVGGTTKSDHEVTLEFFSEIKPDDSKFVTRDRGTEFVLIKADEGPFWKRLLKTETKFHWLKVDFNKWRDEDDSEDDGAGEDGTDFEEMMKKMGGLKSGNTDLADMDNGADSDDEELPDLE